MAALNLKTAFRAAGVGFVFVLATAMIVVAVWMFVHGVKHNHIKDLPLRYCAGLFIVGLLPYIYVFRRQFVDTGKAVADVAEEVAPDLHLGKKD